MDKNFDCVAFQRKAREKLSKEYLLNKKEFRKKLQKKYKHLKKENSLNK